MDLRIEALKRFAGAITILNIAGHLFLGFEASLAHMFAALICAYSLEILFEVIQAKLEARENKFSGGIKQMVYFLLPAHISALAVSMLLFTNKGLMPVIFAISVAILSKLLFKAKINGVAKHFLNPSNTGIAVTLILFPWVGIAQPYQFTENVTGIGDLILPLIFITLGSFLNIKFTKKIFLICGWLLGFALQASVRSFLFDTPLLAGLLPMTGVAFLLYTFYMISDPATTPTKRVEQFFFGFSIAIVYAVLMFLHVVFGLFFALFIVCIARGVYYWVAELSYGFSGTTKTYLQPESVLTQE